MLRFQSSKNIKVKAHESIQFKGSKFLDTSVIFNEKVVTFNNTAFSVAAFLKKQSQATIKIHHGSIQAFIQAKNAPFSSFCKNGGNLELKHHLESLQECPNASIESSK